MKKVLSLLTIGALLTALCLPVVAAPADEVWQGAVRKSITEETKTGLGLAFSFTMQVCGAAVTGTGDYDNTNAVVLHNGTEQKLVTMGAVLTNYPEAGTVDSLLLENVTGKKMIHIEALKLCELEDTALTYAVRVINIPKTALQDETKTTVYARPYYTVEDAAGVQEVVYGDIVSSSYYATWCALHPVSLPAVGSDIDKNARDRIRVSEATINERTVSLTLRNYSSNWITEETDWVAYTCYDADGAVVQEQTKIFIGCIDTKRNKVKTFHFTVPDDTATVALTDSKIVYWTEWT